MHCPLLTPFAREFFLSFLSSLYPHHLRLTRRRALNYYVASFKRATAASKSSPPQHVPHIEPRHYEAPHFTSPILSDETPPTPSTEFLEWIKGKVGIWQSQKKELEAAKKALEAVIDFKTKEFRLAKEEKHDELDRYENEHPLTKDILKLNKEIRRSEQSIEDARAKAIAESESVALTNRITDLRKQRRALKKQMEKLSFEIGQSGDQKELDKLRSQVFSLSQSRYHITSPFFCPDC